MLVLHDGGGGGGSGKLEALHHFLVINIYLTTDKEAMPL